MLLSQYSFYLYCVEVVKFISILYRVCKQVNVYYSLQTVSKQTVELNKQYS